MTDDNTDPTSAEIATERLLRIYYYGLDPPVQRIGAMPVAIAFSRRSNVTVPMKQAAMQPCGRI